jgi:RNA polymerase sigma-70 factor (ECF subfamily)
MSEGVPIDPERLLAQTAWVRRLARSLARDEASADDLVQETFVAALRRPPAGAEDEPRLRAWFGFVLRNMAFRRTRSEARREERERRSADGGRSESDERAEQLEELRAELYRHVKALPESSREVVLLRYFEELDSAQIARRLGVPDSTVRNRLRRALAELRERLGREHGADWRSLCLFVAPRATAQVAGGTGALAAAGGGLWLAGGSVALIGLVLVLWIVRHGSSEPAGRETLAAVPVEIPRSAEGDEPQPGGGRASDSASLLDSERAPQGEPLRIVVSDEYEPPPSSPFAHGIIVHGMVRDEAGEPLDGVQLSWTDPWGRSRGASTGEGKYSANSFAPGLHVLRIGGHACAEEWHEVTLRADEELQAFDYVVSRTHAVPVYLLDPNDENILQAGASGPAMRDACAWAVRTAGPPPKLMAHDYSPIKSEDYHPEWAAMLLGWERREGRPEGALGLIELNGPPPYFVSLVHLGNVIATQRLESIPERITFHLERSLLDHSRQELLASRTWILGPLGTSKELHFPGDGPVPVGTPVRLQFLDPSARPVMACFKFQSPSDTSSGMVQQTGGIDWTGGVFSGAAHANGIFDWELEPGPYVLHITGTRNDDEPNFVRVGALPRRVEIGKGPERTEIVVSLSPLRTVLLRSACTPAEAFRWKISTCDGLSVVEGLLIGRAPKSIGLPAGKFVLEIRARQDGVRLAEQRFEVDDKPLVLELSR